MDGQQSDSRIRQVLDACLARRAAGETVRDEEIVARHPELMPELGAALRAAAVVGAAARRVWGGDDETVVASGALECANADAAEGARHPDVAPVLISESIPGYQILKEIHRGGQGVVYQAVQKSTHRKVAIKVMREGPFAGAADRARFEREVQILGQLQHPNIVGVHDSGSAAGNFFFVMDFVSGQSLDAYLQAGPRSIEATLNLFAKICEAVNAAHLRGVIHRDLKPSNIQVDPSGEPHILDFGLAKVSAFDPIGDGGAALMTMTGQFVGSLPWASPEQAEGQPSKIDVRTDVYSLGVILYQMLTGRFPYEVAGNMRDVLDRILRAEPAKPSTVRKQINDEVETIVLKCLSKERERRYQTAGELGRDVRHYLAGEPIEAKRDSALYVLRKTFQRHRMPVSAAGAILLVILASSVVFAFMYRAQFRLRESADIQRAAAEAQRDRANMEAAKSEAISDFLNRMIASANVEASNPDLRVADVLDEASQELPGDLKDQPLAEAYVRNTLGLSYRSLGKFDRAEEQLRIAHDARRRLLGEDHADTIQSLINIATILRDRNRLDDAEPLMRQALDRATRVFGSADDRTLGALSNLAELLLAQRRLDAAETVFDELRARIDLSSSDISPFALFAANNAANFLIVRRRLDDAETWLNELEPTADALLRDLDPLRFKILANRSALRLRQGKLAECEAGLRRAEMLAARILPDAHPDRLRNDNELCRVLVELGKWDEAAERLKHVQVLQQQTLGTDHADTILTTADLAALQVLRGELDEAARVLPKLVGRAQATLGDRHLVALKAAFELANLRLAQGKLDEAEPVCRETLEIRDDERVYGRRHPERLKTVHQLGRILLARGRWDEADARLREALETAREVLPADHYLAGSFGVDFGICQTRLRRFEPAERVLLDAERVLARALGPIHPRTSQANAALIDLYESWGRAPEAARWRESQQSATSQPIEAQSDRRSRKEARTNEVGATPTGLWAYPVPLAP